MLSSSPEFNLPSLNLLAHCSWHGPWALVQTLCLKTSLRASWQAPVYSSSSSSRRRSRSRSGSDQRTTLSSCRLHCGQTALAKIPPGPLSSSSSSSSGRRLAQLWVLQLEPRACLQVRVMQAIDAAEEMATGPVCSIYCCDPYQTSS